ncbi:protein polybromo-1-like isoform X1 [Branchiostoma floridae x Branchiostoma belcheri]
MAKRRRSSSVGMDVRLDEDMGPSMKTRRKSAPSIDTGEVIQDLYDIIRNHRDENGRLLCDPFIRAPNRRNAPDFYEAVDTPIDMLRIQQRIRTDEYRTLQDFTADVELLVNNAKRYYPQGSQQYNDASALWEIYVEARDEILHEVHGGISGDSMEAKAKRGREEMDETTEEEEEEEDGEEEDQEEIDFPPFAADTENPYEQLFVAMANATDPAGRAMSFLFQKLPVRSEFPEYYKIIKDPMDLTMVARKIKRNVYNTLADMERDISLMVRNAKTFNEPGSLVYKDAVALKKIFSLKKAELEGEPLGVRSSDRSSRRSGRSGLSSRLSAITAALQYSSEEEEQSETSERVSITEYEEESEADSSMYEEGNTFLALYDHVRGYSTGQGMCLSEPFLKLPSKKAYPDYYQEIKHPMSMLKIRSNIKQGLYETLDHLEADFTLMFENAKQYNMTGSRIYKDAVKLQQVMQVKKRELTKSDSNYGDTESVMSSASGVSRKVKRPQIMEDLEERRKKKKKDEGENTLKGRLRFLYDAMIAYCDTFGRFLIELFMEKPSRKDYPEYYKIILEPIDMKTIDYNIRTDKYSSVEAMLEDFDLMFNNARHFNEEGSQVYIDACTLEKVLKDKVKQLGPLPSEGGLFSPKAGLKGPRKSSPKKSKFLTPLQQKLRDMYDAVKDYKDSTGRKLCFMFLQLPSKIDYPDYYQVIKKPIDMQKIEANMRSNKYNTVEDFLEDFLQLFDNACRYNEPDSQIYKDALILQRALLEKRDEVHGDGSSEVPDIRGCVQDLLNSLFVSVLNHQDEEGRCYSDSLSELPEKEDKKEKEQQQEPHKRGPASFKSIRRNLDKGRYRRLDVFQEDVFRVFERARRVSRTDSEMYEDAVELQQFFITIRDEICKNGELMLSPALSYTHKHLQVELDAEKKEKIPKEVEEDKEKKDGDEKEEDQLEEESSETAMQRKYSEDVSWEDQSFRVGDFVYIENQDKSQPPHIVCIEKLFQDDQGDQWLHGCWFYRPKETFHLATRKFLEKEVFKSDYYNIARVANITGRCFVMSVKEYFKSKPLGFSDEDIFVCESRYSARAKAFKKIKIWPTPPSNVKVIPREEPLSKVRVASVFAEEAKAEEQEAETEDQEEEEEEDVIDKFRENIAVEASNTTEPGISHYEQLIYGGTCFKLGDSVYVKSNREQPLMARIDKMWVDANSEPWFHGQWFIYPSETDHNPTRLFYKNEIFLTSMEESKSMRTILGKCCILAYKDYLICRPTEFMEDDIWVCEARYYEADKQIRKIKALKKYSLSPKVTDDEIFFFRKPIIPGKVPSPKLAEISEEPVAFAVPPEAEEELQQPSTPVKAPKAKRPPSGYILFSSEMRATLKKQNPNYAFGEISRIVGMEWKNLSAAQKAVYEERAQQQSSGQNDDESPYPASPASGHSSSRSDPLLLVWECLWEGCDYQYESEKDLVAHLLETSGHLKPEGEQQEYFCYWAGCPRSRVKKSLPFPNISGMKRHVREVHVKTSSRQIPLSQRSRNYVPYQPGYQASPSQSPRPFTPQGSGAVLGVVPPPMPAGMLSQTQMAANGTPGQRMTPGTSQVMTPGQSMNMPANGLQYASFSQIPGAFPPQSPFPQQGGYSQQTPLSQGGPMPQQMFPPQMGPPPVGTTPPAPQYFYGQGGTQYGVHPQTQSPAPPPQPPPPPMFVPPPPKAQRLLHSEAYIRYIEGLKVENRSVSNWEETLTVRQEDVQLTEQQRARLPGHILKNGKGPHKNMESALWALRDLMLKDALTIRKFHH